MSTKRVITAVLVLLTALVAFGAFYTLSYGRSLRFARIVNAHGVLKQACVEYSAHGRVEPNGSWKPFVLTNTVVVDGTNFYPVVGVAVVGFEGEGVLAMTTNETLIWRDRTRSPKIIPTTGYRPHFFPERF